jgi:hypothetical protein
MQAITTTATGAKSTGAFEVTLDCTVVVEVSHGDDVQDAGAWNSGTVTMQVSRDKGANWQSFGIALAGTVQGFTEYTHCTYRPLAGGRYYRFLNDGTVAAATSVWVSGAHVNANVYDPSAVT